MHISMYKGKIIFCNPFDERLSTEFPHFENEHTKKIVQDYLVHIHKHLRRHQWKIDYLQLQQLKYIPLYFLVLNIHTHILKIS